MSTSYQPITAAGVAGAQPLDMDPHRRSAQDLTITVRCRVDSFDTEICFQGDIERLHAVVARLRVLGAEPVSAPQSAPAPAANGKAKAERVEPLYKPDGTACCPVHKRGLSEGAHGLFCSAKATGDQVADKKGYCGLRFIED